MTACRARSRDRPCPCCCPCRCCLCRTCPCFRCCHDPKRGHGRRRCRVLACPCFRHGRGGCPRAPFRGRSATRPRGPDGRDRKSGGEGKGVSVSVDLGGRRIIKKK